MKMQRNGDRRKRYDWLAVQQFFEEGNGFVACRQRFGFSHTAWIKAINRGELTVPRPSAPFSDRRLKYDWTQIQAFYDCGHSYGECRQRFGFRPASWTKAIKRGQLSVRARRDALARIHLPSRSRATVKRRLLTAGILVNECEDCGLSEWRGKPLSIQIDHRNGVRDDHRLENLRMLCPNCHSRTATFGGKKRTDGPGSSNGRTADSDSAYRGSSP